MTEVAYLSIDPGDTSGWATFNNEGGLLAYGQVDEADFNRWLNTTLTENPNIKVIICENYINAAYKANVHISRRNRTNKTSKKIGAIETLAEIHGIFVCLQPNTVKSIGYKWSSFEQPTNHNISHQFDAVAHGIYYLVSNGIRNVADVLKRMT